MFAHWVATAWRSLAANPLFSLITIISLSIGCCGALLVGANIKQHLSFERWVPAADRIFILTRDVDEGSFSQGAPAIRLPQSSAPAPMRDVVAQMPDVELTARMFRGASLLPQDPSIPTEPALPGEPPRTPPPGSVYVDPEFFEMFGLEFVEGSAAGLSEPNQIVITETAAKRVFGDVSPVGQVTEGAGKLQVRVAGVIRDLPSTTHLNFEALSSVRTLEQITAASNATPNSIPRSINAWSNGVTATLYIRARAGADAKLFAASLKHVAQAAADQGAGPARMVPGPGGSPPLPNLKYTYDAAPLLDIHLGGPELTANSSAGDATLLLALGTAAVALLAVSAFNYVTLSLARVLRRRREVAVRKVLGADQGSLVRHYLAESAVVTAIALVIGFLLAQFLHPWFARVVGQPETLFNLFDPAFLAGSLVAFGLLALAVGAYPAFYLSATRPSRALGEGGAASPGRMSQLITGGLMGLQISAATALLIIAMTMAAQANYIENRFLGLETRDRYRVVAPCPFSPQTPAEELTRMQSRCLNGARQILSRASNVSRPAYFDGALFSSNLLQQSFGRSAAGEKLGEGVTMSVDLEFLQTMNARLLAGRLFDSASAYDGALSEYETARRARMKTTVQVSDAGIRIFSREDPSAGPSPPPPVRVPIVISRAFLPLLGADAPEEAIGQRIASQLGGGGYPYEIVGVVDDWHHRPLKFTPYPLIFVPRGGSNAIVEVAKDSVESVQSELTQAWRDYHGNAPNATVTLQPLSQTLERAYRADFLLMSMVTMFAFVAIAVAGMGVYGLSAFEMRRRVREIGIRKALGASPFAVGALAIGRALVFAGIASLIAWPFGFWIANEWLLSFVYRTSLGWAVLPAASAVIIVFVAFAVSLSAMRAAAIRPSAALRM